MGNFGIKFPFRELLLLVEVQVFPYQGRPYPKQFVFVASCGPTQRLQEQQRVAFPALFGVGGALPALFVSVCLSVGCCSFSSVQFSRLPLSVPVVTVFC
jgi:hypothetical protein